MNSRERRCTQSGEKKVGKEKKKHVCLQGTDTGGGAGQEACVVKQYSLIKAGACLYCLGSSLSCKLSKLC